MLKAMTFTTTHKLNQTLALLQQLPGNSDLIPLVLAPVDAGKTSLWQQLSHKPAGHWRLAAISAHAKMTRSQLMRLLAKEWLPGKEEISYAQFIEELKQITRQGKLPVLALDNADALAPELFQLLRQLPIGLICFAENPPGGSEEGFQVLPLSPWNAEEIAAFVRFKRGAAPTAFEVDRLLLGSEGLPGRLVRLLEGRQTQASAEAPQTAKASTKRKGLTQNQLNLGLMLLALVLLLTLGLVFNKERIPWLAKSQENAEEMLTPGLEPEELESEEAPKILESPKPESTLPPLTEVMKEAQKKPPAPETKAEPAPPEEENAEPAPEAVPEPKPEPEPAPKAPARESLLHGPEWLLQQPKEHHGIEMVELESLDALETYVKKHGLHGSVPLSWLATKGKKPGYQLILGNYPDKQAAARARLMLPDAINIDKVKVRSFAEIQRLIKGN